MKRLHLNEVNREKEIKNLKIVLISYCRSTIFSHLEATPKSIRARMDLLRARLAGLLLDAGEYRESRELFAGLSWKVFGREKYCGISRALMGLEEYERAEKLLVKGLKRFPDSAPGLYISLAKVYLDTGRRSDARNTATSGCTVFPEHRNLRLLLHEIEDAESRHTFQENAYQARVRHAVST